MPKPTPDQNRMKWAVEFMNMDLDPLCEKNLVTQTEKQIAMGDLAKLRVGFQRFLGEQVFPLVRTPGWPDYTQLWGPRSVIVSPNEKPYPREFTVDDFEKLQPKVREIIEWDVWQSEKRQELESKGRLHEFGQAREGHKCPEVPIEKLKIRTKLSKEGWHYEEVDGPTADAFFYKLQDLIRNQTTEQIHRCKHCEKIFFQIGKKQFCSTVCSRAAKKLKPALIKTKRGK